MTYSSEPILTALRAARRRKGLSQRALGERVGWPQSHISKIENGGADLQLSSLIELARALDLDIQIVPRAAAPLVASVARAAADESADATSRALDHIERAQQAAGSLLRSPVLYPDLVELRNRLEQLKRFRFNPSNVAALSKALEPLDLVLRRTDQLGQPAEQLGRLATAYNSPIRSITESLKTLRGQLAPARSEEPTRQLPAYRLDDDDE